MQSNTSDIVKCKSFAIMGGTFDPIHYGHLATAEAVRYHFQVDRVLFVPTGRPVHKDQTKVTNNQRRYDMTVLATQSNPNFQVSRIEIDRPGPTYTIDTIKELKNICGEDVRFYFIMGADGIHDIFTWKNYEELLRTCEFIAVTRPGYRKENLVREIQDLMKEFGGTIHFMEVPALDISSSDIRNKIRQGIPVKYLLPESVEEYIKKYHLYD